MILAAIFSIVIVTTLTVAIGPQIRTSSDDSPAATPQFLCQAGARVETSPATWGNTYSVEPQSGIESECVFHSK